MNDATQSIEKENFINNKLFNMWSFGRWGCAKMKPMQENLVHTWTIGKTSFEYIVVKTFANSLKQNLDVTNETSGM
jgi:hypothetical protein